MRAKNLDIDVRRLDSGDYVFGRECSVAIERKTIRDLMDFRRYFSQLKVLKETYVSPIVLLEGSLFNILDEFERRNVLGAWAVTILNWRIPVIETRTMEETVWRISQLFIKEGQGKSGRVPPTIIRKAEKPEDIRLNMLTCIPRLGSSLAKRILSKYGLRDLSSWVTEEMLRGIEGIGEKRASLIREVFQGSSVKEERKEE